MAFVLKIIQGGTKSLYRPWITSCMVHTSSPHLVRDKGHLERQKKLTVRQENFFDEAALQAAKNKETFEGAVDVYLKREGVHRRGQVEFIYAALKKMKEFGVDQDLEVYKHVLKVFPEKKMVAKTTWQMEMMHYPKQQECGIDILCQMEDKGIVPDDETGYLLVKIFGEHSYVMRKYQRMMYWMPKFKNINPWPIPKVLPKDPTVLARMILKRMSVDVLTDISVCWTHDLDEAYDKTFVASAQSPDQIKLVNKHPLDLPVYVEGGFRVHFREKDMTYFVLRAEADPKRFVQSKEEDGEDYYDFAWSTLFGEEVPKELVESPTVHEQEDGTILAMCITGTGSLDSLKSWIRFLQISNPKLSEIPVVFKLITPEAGIIKTENEDSDRSVNVNPS